MNSLKQRYGSQFSVYLENHPPTPMARQIASLLTFTQYSLIAFTVLAETICDALSIQLPRDLTTTLREKRFAILMGVWFVGNTFINSLRSTGAFEVLYGTDIVFSKLNSGRMPSIDEILDGVQEAMSASS